MTRASFLIRCVACVFLALLSPLALAKPPAPPANITITLHPLIGFHRLLPMQRVFGSLEFLKGYVLTSPDPAFGGISGVRALDAGRRFVAVTDSGYWLSFDVTQDANTAITSLKTATIAAMRDQKGQAYRKKAAADAESLALTLPPHQKFVVSFEGDHRLLVWQSPLENAMRTSPKPFVSSSLFEHIRKKLSYNSGIEALAFAPENTPYAGDLFLFSEKIFLSKDPAGNVLSWGWRLSRTKTSSYALADSLYIAQKSGFQITDAHFLPNGDLILLERSVGFPRFRLRRIPQETLEKKNANEKTPLDGETLLSADFLLYNADNMEALAIHTDADGNAILTILSDDNHQPWQKTLLLQFRLNRTYTKAGH